jgi:hypothetical protein
MLTLLLCASLAGVPSREAPRLHAAVEFVAGGGYGLATNAIAGGPGLSVDLGVVLNDAYSVVARATAGTVIGLTSWLFGAAFEMVLTDKMSLSAGLAWGATWGLEAAGALSVSAPFRFTFAPFPRGAQDVAKRGLVLLAEVAPGYAYFNGYGRSRPVDGPESTPRAPLALAAFLGIGYAWR